jgi:hypothetical protein
VSLALHDAGIDPQGRARGKVESATQHSVAVTGLADMAPALPNDTPAVTAV